VVMQPTTCAIAESLSSLDVVGGSYPAGVVTESDRRRWNQARLVALALARVAEPDMPNAAYVYMQARAIYQQEELATGTDAELAEAIAVARSQGWL
jgi:hypothetical protein